jgi:hypothetical protein
MRLSESGFWLRAALLAALVVFAAACSNMSTMRVGRNFDYVNFANKVQPGVTPVTQVKQWLGEPASKGAEVYADGTRYEVWTYYYVEAKVPSGSDSRLKLLQIKVDAQGRVAGYTWSGEFANATGAESKSAKM